MAPGGGTTGSTGTGSLGWENAGGNINGIKLHVSNSIVPYETIFPNRNASFIVKPPF
jgi:hypothetical protein